MKINKYLMYSLLLVGGVFASCDDYENSIEDFPLLKEIPSLPPDPSIAVGAYLVNPELTDLTRWGRLSNPFNDGPASQGGGRVGPYLKPTQGQYEFVAADSTTALIFRNMVRWAQQAGIDFFITPPLKSHRWNEYPNNLNGSDTLLINLISGRNDSLGYANRGDIKYAICYDMENFANTLGTTSLSNEYLLEDSTDFEYEGFLPPYQVATDSIREATGVAIAAQARITREQRLYRVFKRIATIYFNDENYQTTPDGRPVLFLQGAHRLFTQKPKEVYENIRDTVLKYSGKEVYLVARQEQWTPTARFAKTMLDGGVDAVTENAFTNAGNWDRVYMLNPLIDAHMKANKDFLNRQYPDIDYIPSVSPSFSGYVDNGDVKRIIVPKEEKGFRERCNIAKMNQGQVKMVILDSFNGWNRESQIEPADPDYGNGYGTFYLDIFKSEFKGR